MKCSARWLGVLFLLFLTIIIVCILGHPTCLELTLEMVSVIKSYPWQCMECKTCVECMEPHDEVGPYRSGCIKDIVVWL